MKASELKKLLENEPDDAEVIFSHEYDCATVHRKIHGVIHEDDGFGRPKVMLCDDWSFDKYDEDYEHGFKKEL